MRMAFNAFTAVCMQALRQQQGLRPYIAIHSRTAVRQPHMTGQLCAAPYSCNIVVDRSNEAEMMAALANLAAGWLPWATRS